MDPRQALRFCVFNDTLYAIAFIIYAATLTGSGPLPTARTITALMIAATLATHGYTTGRFLQLITGEPSREALQRARHMVNRMVALALLIDVCWFVHATVCVVAALVAHDVWGAVIWLVVAVLLVWSLNGPRRGSRDRAVRLLGEKSAALRARLVVDGPTPHPVA